VEEHQALLVRLVEASEDFLEGPVGLDRQVLQER
jgi:hypothetical protein